MKKLYYYFWAQIRGLDSWLRILFVVGIVTILLYLLLRLTYPIWRRILLHLHRMMNRAYYLLKSDCFYDRIIQQRTKHHKDIDSAVDSQNRFCESRRRVDENINIKMASIREKKFSSGWGILMFLVLYLLIYLPGFLESRLTVITAVSDMYSRIEADGIEGSYELVPKKRALASSESETEQGAQKTGEVKLKLNKNGNKGSNVRSEPNGSKICVIEGDIVFIFIEKDSSGKWCRIRLEDGTEGWIYSNLVEEADDGTDRD